LINRVIREHEQICDLHRQNDNRPPSH